MPDILHKILDHKRLEVERALRREPERRLRERATQRGPRRPFFETLADPGPGGVNIIAEIKRRSPSRGDIREDLDPASLACAYERGGARALSVLTDSAFFGARPEDLAEARSAANLPVLRKDFIVSAYQILEAAAMGADAVLLIVGAVTAPFLRDALCLCAELDLDALVEVHCEAEIETAVEAGARLVGINNRDLRTFQTDLAVTARLSRLLGPGQVPVGESGIRDRADVLRLLEGGVWNFLIGESLVRSQDPEGFLQALLGHGGALEGSE